MTDRFAVSGHWQDLQAAISQAVAGDRVVIPNGTHNYCDSGESWHTLTIPSGVSLVSQSPPTGSDYGLAIPNTWSTILRANIDSGGRQDPGTKAVWFKVGNGTYNANHLFRFSGIKMVGYRYSEASATEMEIALELHGVRYRIDHSCFENLGGDYLFVPCWYQDNMSCHGVTDHSKAYNNYGYDVLGQYTQGNIDYAANLQRAYYATASGGAMPCPPTMDVLGHDTVFTHFFENCFFKGWRHIISNGHGAFYVFRYNYVDQDFGHFSLDVHGLRDSEAGRAGGRGIECYENTLINPTDMDGLFQTSGGCGAWFNNYTQGYYGITLSEFIPPLDNPLWNLKDFYMWSAKGTPPSTPSSTGTNVAVDWAHPAGNAGGAGYPNPKSTWSIVGYVPYVYPHPLVTDEPIPLKGTLSVDAGIPIGFTLQKIA